MTFEAAVARLKFLSGKKFDSECVVAFDKAYDAGDVTPAKARKASLASRQFEIDVLMGGGTAPATPVAAADASAAPV